MGGAEGSLGLSQASDMLYMPRFDENLPSVYMYQFQRSAPVGTRHFSHTVTVELYHCHSHTVGA